MNRSIVFIETDGGAVEIEVSHVEARRLIREHQLAKRRPDDETTHPVGSWSKEGGRYFIHLRT